MTGPVLLFYPVWCQVKLYAHISKTTLYIKTLIKAYSI